MTYASSRQDDRGPSAFLLRTQGDPLALLRPFRRELAAIDPEIAISKASTLRSYLAEGLAGRRLPVVLMTAFGALALLLASVGVYAMFASMVAAREREFGLRVALGSTRRRHRRRWCSAQRRRLDGRRPRRRRPRRRGGRAASCATCSTACRRSTRSRSGPPSSRCSLCATVALLVPVRRATRVDPITVIRA